jgi:hypothetical protein
MYVLNKYFDLRSHANLFKGVANVQLKGFNELAFIPICKNKQKVITGQTNEIQSNFGDIGSRKPNALLSLLF